MFGSDSKPLGNVSRLGFEFCKGISIQNVQLSRSGTILAISRQNCVSKYHTTDVTVLSRCTFFTQQCNNSDNLGSKQNAMVGPSSSLGSLEYGD